MSKQQILQHIFTKSRPITRDPVQSTQQIQTQIPISNEAKISNESANTKLDIGTVFTFILNDPDEKKYIKELICKFSEIFENIDILLVDNNSGESMDIIRKDFDNYKISEFVNINNIEL